MSLVIEIASALLKGSRVTVSCILIASMLPALVLNPTTTKPVLNRRLFVASLVLVELPAQGSGWSKFFLVRSLGLVLKVHPLPVHPERQNPKS